MYWGKINNKKNEKAKPGDEMKPKKSETLMVGLSDEEKGRFGE